MFKFKEFLGKKLLTLFQKWVNEEEVERLEELFFEADLGLEMSQELTEKVRALMKKKSHLTGQEVLEELKKEILATVLPPPERIVHKPHVILIIGVNGNGKTTTIAKLAHRFKREGKSLLLISGDTFRAGANDQLTLWANRLEIDIVQGKQHGDAASVIYDGMQAAQARKVDVVLIDTAGRLHTKAPLMQELEKIYRVIKKVNPEAPHDTYLILDATVGKNSLEQAALFHKATPLTGLILTKIDGTSKGGAVIALQRKMKLPILYVGTGEGIEDLQPFNPSTFVHALFE